MYDNEEQGIYYDLMKQLSDLTQMKFEWKHYPYARLDMLFRKGHIHVEVGSSPLWTAHKSVPGIYTQNFYILEDVVVFREGNLISVTSTQDIIGKKIGMVRGYSFPQFQKLFDEGSAVRLDATNELKLLDMLLHGRIDQIFISRDLLRYHQKISQKYRALVAGDVVGSYEIGIRVNPEYKNLLPPLNQAITELKATGAIGKIFDKHLSQ